jgi:hypothetical protein
MKSIKTRFNDFIEKYKTPIDPKIAEQVADLEKDYLEIEELIEGNVLTFDRKVVSKKLMALLDKWKGNKIYLDQIRNGRTNAIMRALILE